MRRLPLLPFLAAAILAFPGAGRGSEPRPGNAGVLPPEVKQALTLARLPNDAVAFLVAPVDGGEPILAINARTSFNPASVMKLVTTYAALELLGPAHVWQTEVLADPGGPTPADGVVDGPIYLRGNGDPRLNLQHFWLLLRELRLRGVREIRGDLVLDRSAFALPPHDPAAFDNEPLRPYNAGADALLVNFASLRFLLVPDLEQKKVLVLQESPDARIEVRNRLLLAGGDRAECGDWRDRLTIRVDNQRIELAGRFPAACGEKALNLMPLPPDAQVEGVFRALWAELGGQFGGRVRAGNTPPAARAILVKTSAPLGELVRDINKFSNNVMARHAFLALSAGQPATYEGARLRVHEWLRGKGIDPAGLVIDNGSGLSRHDRISAEQLRQLLAAAWSSPVMPELMASLPVLGEDGTLKQRGNGNGRGRAHLKTGYIEGARALAGYVLDHKGRRWILVALVNHAQAAKGKEAIDRLVEWTLQGGEAAAAR